MQHQLQTYDDPDTLAKAAAAYVAERARAAVATGGLFRFAVSGGHTPWQMFAQLTSLDVPWDRTVVYQVDERAAPIDDPDRNLAHLRDALEGHAVDIQAMPVEDPDPDAAADRYGALLPDRFDLVHLGIGPDGHTASLVPGDPVLDVTDRPVAMTVHEYQGRRRMTLTYPALSRADQILWLVEGEDKRDALSKLLAGDRSIPAGRVEATASLVMTDRSAV